MVFATRQSKVCVRKLSNHILDSHSLKLSLREAPCVVAYALAPQLFLKNSLEIGVRQREMFMSSSLKYRSLALRG